MIYTLTLNPSLDYAANIRVLVKGALNRTSKESLTAGGKGINVSLMLKTLGIQSEALGFEAGFTGEQIKTALLQSGIKNDFVKVKNGISRINVKLLESDGTETEINASGPSIEKEEREALLKKLDSIQNKSTLVLAGSVPPSLPKDFYAQIMERLKNKEIDFVVDASGPLLQTVLELKPFLIKPNLYELQELFSTKICGKDEVVQYAQRLREKGALNVLVSLGKDGAVLASQDGSAFFAAAPNGKAVNTVGSGDSMLAAFIASFAEEKSFSKALAASVCAGSATAFSKGLASREEILTLFKDYNGVTLYKNERSSYGRF